MYGLVSISFLRLVSRVMQIFVRSLAADTVEKICFFDTPAMPKGSSRGGTARNEPPPMTIYTRCAHCRTKAYDFRCREFKDGHMVKYTGPEYADIIPAWRCLKCMRLIWESDPVHGYTGPPPPPPSGGGGKGKGKVA